MGLHQFDHKTRLITLSVITLSGFHCICKIVQLCAHIVNIFGEITIPINKKNIINTLWLLKLLYLYLTLLLILSQPLNGIFIFIDVGNQNMFSLSFKLNQLCSRKYNEFKYGQTCANNHLWTMTTCLQQTAWSPIFQNW